MQKKNGDDDAGRDPDANHHGFGNFQCDDPFEWKHY